MNNTFNYSAGTGGITPRDLNSLVSSRVAIHLRTHPAGAVLPAPERTPAPGK